MQTPFSYSRFPYALSQFRIPPSNFETALFQLFLGYQQISTKYMNFVFPLFIFCSFMASIIYFLEIRCLPLCPARVHYITKLSFVNPFVPLRWMLPDRLPQPHCLGIQIASISSLHPVSDTSAFQNNPAAHPQWHLRPVRFRPL